MRGRARRCGSVSGGPTQRRMCARWWSTWPPRWHACAPWPRRRAASPMPYHEQVSFRARRTERMINVTTTASEKIKEALQAEGKPNLRLRIYVEGGGCSGMQYGLVFEEDEQDGDEILTKEGFDILVDRFSAPYLTGVEIDYVTTLQGAGFKINNPNATGSCGCGHSFKA